MEKDFYTNLMKEMSSMNINVFYELQILIKISIRFRDAESLRKYVINLKNHNQYTIDRHTLCLLSCYVDYNQISYIYFLYVDFSRNLTFGVFMPTIKCRLFKLISNLVRKAKNVY